jgi:hypothetical protein
MRSTITRLIAAAAILGGLGGAAAVPVMSAAPAATVHWYAPVHR